MVERAGVNENVGLVVDISQVKIIFFLQERKKKKDK